MTVDAIWYYSSSPTGRFRAHLWSTPMSGYGFIVQGRLLTIDLLIDQNPWMSSEWHAHRAEFRWRKSSLIDADELFIANWLTTQRFQLTTTVRMRQTGSHQQPSEWDYFLLLLHAFQFGVRLTPTDLHRFNATRQLRQLTLDFRPLEKNQFIWRENLAWSKAEAIDDGQPTIDHTSTSITESIVVEQLWKNTELAPTVQSESLTWITDDQLSDLLPEEIDVDDLRHRLHLVSAIETT